jgi:hypothetical protein
LGIGVLRGGIVSGEEEWWRRNGVRRRRNGVRNHFIHY